MKKLALSAFVMGVAFMAVTAQAETMKGKLIGKQDNTIQVQNSSMAQPTTLKTTKNTRYFEKKQVSKDADSMSDVDADLNEWVEIVYTIDPTTNELIISELVIMED